MFIVIGATSDSDGSVDTFVIKAKDTTNPTIFSSHDEAISAAKSCCTNLIEEIVKECSNNSPHEDQIQRERFSIVTGINMVEMGDNHRCWELRVVPLNIPKNDYEIHRTGFQNYALWCKGNPINITSSQIVVDSWKKQFNIV
jgi:hypothetical protein